jgi:hypothetical protein
MEEVLNLIEQNKPLLFKNFKDSYLKRGYLSCEFEFSNCEYPNGKHASKISKT